MNADAIVQRLADLLVAARRERRQFDVAAIGGDLASVEQAYAVQDRVGEALGWFAHERARAWKAGADAPGATPYAAPLPPRGIVASPARFAAGSFHSIRIEAEIAFRFGEDVAAAKRSSDWTAWIDALVVTIEVVDGRIADVGRASAPVKIADGQQHGALVVGSSTPYRALDWSGVHAIVRRNGAVVADVRGSHRLGNPGVLVPWFVAHAEARGCRLVAGDLVTAGSWVGMLEAAPGDTVDAEFEGIGRATAVFD